MHQVDCLLEWSDEWRIEERTPLDAWAHVEWQGGDRQKVRVRALDLSESGLSFLSRRAPGVGERLCVELGGFFIEAVVRNVRDEGLCYRIGVESL